MRLTFDLNLTDERSDGLDRVGHREEPEQRQARVRQAPMNTLSNRPNLRFAGQRREGLHRIVGHDVVELTDEPLIGSKDDCADGGPAPFGHALGRFVCPKACGQPQLQSPIVIG